MKPLKQHQKVEYLLLLKKRAFKLELQAYILVLAFIILGFVCAIVYDQPLFIRVSFVVFYVPAAIFSICKFIQYVIEISKINRDRGKSSFVRLIDELLINQSNEEGYYLKRKQVWLKAICTQKPEAHKTYLFTIAKHSCLIVHIEEVIGAPLAVAAIND